jgi:hypothetical protein
MCAVDWLSVKIRTNLLNFNIGIYVMLCCRDIWLKHVAVMPAYSVSNEHTTMI